jgi:lycopene cyclase CruA
MARDEARARVREAGGEELCERLEVLDKARAARSRNKKKKPAHANTSKRTTNTGRLDFDVVIAGGGLSLLLAPLLADRGLRVAVLDRSRVGGVHREWNAGEAEITALVKSGVLSAAEINELVVARYTEGFCRWHGGGTYPVTGVLDCAIDAGALLAKARARAEERGVSIEDRCSLEEHAEGPGGVELRVTRGEGARAETITSKIMVDARGAASPFATADLICPTVGGVLSGLAEGDGPLEMRPDVGEILVTTEGIEEGRQHLWEAFPGRPGETTVYLFYYARSEDVPEGSLLSLYARFFALLSRYKRGNAKLERPTFGYIPGWSRLCDPPAPPGRRVMLVGDAAARHSPLTFCGFGATVRSLSATADAIADAAAKGGRSMDPLADAPIHAGTGALSMLMATPPRDPARAGSINKLLDAAFAELHAMGNQTYGDLMRDSMSAADFVRFLRATAARRPEVYREVMGSLKLGALGRWGLGLAKELFFAR